MFGDIRHQWLEPVHPISNVSRVPPAALERVFPDFNCDSFAFWRIFGFWVFFLRFFWVVSRGFLRFFGGFYFLKKVFWVVSRSFLRFFGWFLGVF